MFERWTDRARRAVVIAQEEARMMRHAEVGNGHLLTGLAAEEGGVASQALAALGLTPDAARDTLRLIIPALPSAPASHIPLTRGLKKAAENALRESLAMNVTYIGTEHLLLGLLRDVEGPADKILIAAGIAPIVVRGEVMRLLGSYEKTGRVERKAATPVPAEPPIVSISTPLDLTDDALAAVNRLHDIIHPARPGGVYAAERNPGGCDKVFCCAILPEVTATVEPAIRADERERTREAIARIERLAATAQETAIAHAVRAERARLREMAEARKGELVLHGLLSDAVPWTILIGLIDDIQAEAGDEVT
jgi:hypothetical protein